jgi:hypothetical protein
MVALNDGLVGIENAGLVGVDEIDEVDQMSSKSGL